MARRDKIHQALDTQVLLTIRIYNIQYHQTFAFSYHIAVCWLVVLGGAEASQPLLEHEYAEGVT